MKNFFLTFVLCIVSCAVGFAGSYVAVDAHYTSQLKSDVMGELSIHFLELGNGYTGDCVYIKAGDTDVLVDAGSRSNSVSAITTYLDGFVEDDKIEYLIVTHADQDHIAGFAGTTKANTSIFDFYKFGTIIDFPLTDKTTATYNRYIEKRNLEVSNDGAIRYSALECYNNQNGAQRTYDLGSGVELEILYNYFYEHSSSDENNYSVCFMLKHCGKNFLFTGDLEEKGEEYLVEYNDLPEVELFKAGHHGSKTSSTETLLSVIKPKIVCVTCCAGSVEYTQNLENTFPTQIMINNVAKYTDDVYVTTVAQIEQVGGEYEDVSFSSMNGNIVVTSTRSGVDVNCSNNNTLLKDTEWFREYRECPADWAA